MLKEYLENEVIFTETELKSKYINCDCPIMANKWIRIDERNFWYSMF